MSVNLSHGGPNIHVSDEPARALIVATVDGVVRLERESAGAPWTEVRRTLPGKHVSAVMRAPGGVLLAGTHGQGLHVSTDDGESWGIRARGLVSEHIYSLNYVEAGDGVRLYAGTEPANLHVSKDMGETWQVLPSIRMADSVAGWKFPPPPHIAHLKSIAFQPGRPDTIYACIEVGALLKSTDAGATWRELSGEAAGLYEDVHRIAIPPLEPEHVYVATGNGIYHSLNGGDDWERLTDQSLRVGYPDGLVMHPEHPELMFTAGAITWPRDWPKIGSADPRVMRSTDAGRSWDVVNAGFPEHLHGNIEALVMNLWPAGFGLYAGTTDGDIFASEDGGETWTNIASGLPAVSKTSHFMGLARLKEQAAVAAT